LSKKIILLAGPTASGKSKLATSLARKLNGEIINADSMQVFKEFKILSSRPSSSDTQNIKHHLYGVISVKRYFSAGDWLKQAKKKINSCIKKKKIPIVVGGTGLYFNTITKGISKIPNIDLKTRNKVRNLYKKIGFKRFYDLLLKLDPKIKGRILPTDSQRVQRAYEVKLKTKKSLFDWFVNTKSDFLDFEIKKIFIDIPRDELLKKISHRTELMIKKKCINEVRKFNRLKIKKNLSANKLIGVQEINDFLKSSISLDQCKELINIKTRQYAKRQNTWARGHMKNWNKLYSKNFSILLKKSLKVVS
jgi:tRNA dimethylallyltransferase